MAERTVAEKLQIKSGVTIAVVNPPDDYERLVGGLPAGARVELGRSSEADVVHLFVRDRADLARLWPEVARAMRENALLWVSYPKRGPGVATDLTRDTGWGPLRDSGWDPVSQIAIDERWSAMRWRQDPGLRERREARGARVGRD